ncbi:MAG: hypothetical protein HN742_39205 [Lentisphaerae bacterium]|jgi:hypothetical protein|nr:hypothetical protein [Lentisphaerota bacterium]MBT4814131.1 hypothetical protein [Lentisphaerota bacterium]MBT5609982.1 hypothetical protein [Lentisphaerota bacterium]MBT7060641.1 hypothetical protein [Lentisphaerota bacterium]MBT7847961.1 hypothetical protein [Lentisphaerota bacterium]
MRQLSTILLVWSVSCLGAATDTPWYIAEGKARVLVRVTASGGAGIGSLVYLPKSSLPPEATELRAWSVVDRQPMPAQRLPDGTVAVDLDGVADTDEIQLFIYTIASTPPPAPKPLSPGSPVSVATRRYKATIAASDGGKLSSLRLKGENGEETEILGEGVRWWHRSSDQPTVESFGAVQPTCLANGPLVSVWQVNYPDFPAEGCSMTTTYSFCPDYIDVDYEVHIPGKVGIKGLKLPVNLRGGGDRAGLYSNSTMQDDALHTAGGKKRWLPDRRWHDVSYLGENAFGLGVIARDVQGALYFMDAVTSEEEEWIYAEPYGWEKTVEVNGDFAVRLRLVPHQAGEGRWRETAGRLPGLATVSCSVQQARGGPPIDTDQDGLLDLDELLQHTNPNVADTDLDGVPDGSDRSPLTAPPPRKKPLNVRFKKVKGNRGDPLAQIRDAGGVPTIFVDGKPYGPMMLTKCAASYEQLREYGEKGFQLHFEMVGSVGWPGEQLNTFRRLDQRINRFLDQIPNARIILRLYLCNPQRFALDYPEETLRFNDGRIDHFSKWYAMRDRAPEERGYPSFASDVWREKTAEALHHYVSHVRTSPYARNVIGYFICGGGTEEWYYWGDYDHNKLALDFSPPMLREFRAHLQRTYDGDVRKLRTAWADPTADFATALPPGPEQRSRSDWGVFLSPRTQARVRDYYIVHNKVMEDSLLLFARTAKKACDSRQLVGMFHGYLQNHWLLEGGQATLKDLLNSPDVDFWSGPPQYNRRGQGEHACNRFLDATLKVHGKLWISESDIRTCFSAASGSNPSLHGRTPDLAASLGVLTREFSHQLCNGNNGWWFPMGSDWYSHEPVMTRFGEFQRVGKAAVHHDRRSATDVAAVVDMESLLTGRPWPVSSSVIGGFKTQELCRLGTPVDFYELDDLLARSAPRYRLVIMLNTFSLTSRERRLVEKRLRRRGTTIVWMLAPGLFNPDIDPELSLDHARQLLGYGLQQERGDGLHYTMQLTESGRSAFPSTDAARVFGSFERPEWKGAERSKPKPSAFPQRFYALPTTEVEVLARFTEGRKPALVRRGNEYWVGSVMAPADLLRDIARQAGCHIYCDADEIVYANQSFLAMHAAEQGERRFQLREPADIVDVFSGQILARDATHFIDAIDAFETRLYFLGDAEKWRGSLRAADMDLSAFHTARTRGLNLRAKSVAANTITPATPVDRAGLFRTDAQGMVTHFLFCGPFPNPGAPKLGFDRDFLGGERAPTPVLRAEIATVFEAKKGSPAAITWFKGNAERRELRNTWRPIHTSMDVSVLSEQLPDLFTNERVAYYLACCVDLKHDLEVRVGVGSDDGFKLWVNGTLQGGLDAHRGAGIDQNRYTVPMHAGPNWILLKIIQGGGASGWSLRLATPDGSSLAGQSIRLQMPGQQ